MSIRRKILLYFSVSICFIIGLSFLVIYYLSAEYREENFQLRQKEKISTILEVLADVKYTEDELINTLDNISIQELTNDKLLLFNSQKKLIYSNLLDEKINYSKTLLKHLNSNNKWIEERDGTKDVLGIYIQKKGNSYYGISIAYDDFGYSKLHFLGFTLFLTFVIITAVIVLVSFYISKKITAPLYELTEKISTYNPSEHFDEIQVPVSNDETTILAKAFNTQLQKINELFSFQNHTIHHISHELKTPIAILVSNFERMEKETDLTQLKELLIKQKEDTKALSEIISSLLEIAKLDAGQTNMYKHFRIDELLFDTVEEIKHIYSDARITINYDEPVDDSKLLFFGSQRLIKSALANLVENGIQYSNDHAISVTICTNNKHLELSFINNGQTLSITEQKFLFEHFFRGNNSHEKKGFGLGLIFVKKILLLHNGSIHYSSCSELINCFRIKF